MDTVWRWASGPGIIFKEKQKTNVAPWSLNAVRGAFCTVLLALHSLLMENRRAAIAPVFQQYQVHSLFVALPMVFEMKNIVLGYTVLSASRIALTETCMHYAV